MSKEIKPNTTVTLDSITKIISLVCAPDDCDPMAAMHEVFLNLSLPFDYATICANLHMSDIDKATSLNEFNSFEEAIRQSTEIGFLSKHLVISLVDARNPGQKAFEISIPEGFVRTGDHESTSKAADVQAYSYNTVLVTPPGEIIITEFKNQRELVPVLMFGINYGTGLGVFDRKSLEEAYEGGELGMIGIQEARVIAYGIRFPFTYTKKGEDLSIVEGLTGQLTIFEQYNQIMAAITTNHLMAASIFPLLFKSANAA